MYPALTKNKKKRLLEHFKELPKKPNSTSQAVFSGGDPFTLSELDDVRQKLKKKSGMRGSEIRSEM